MSTRLLALALLTCAASIARAADCPLNHFSLSSPGEFSSLAVDSRTQSSNCTSSSANYDVPAGTLAISFGCGGSCGECGSGAGVYVEDDFSVLGLPSGTPVALTARMTGTLGGGFGGFEYVVTSATLKDTNGHVVTASVDPQGGYGGNLNLSLPVDAVAGQVFRLHFELSGYSLGPLSGSASAAFSFSGLAPGTAVISCQGYVSDRTVPARRSTWGRLKAAYR
jgi:hypothetical protein